MKRRYGREGRRKKSEGRRRKDGKRKEGYDQGNGDYRVRSSSDTSPTPWSLPLKSLLLKCLLIKQNVTDSPSACTGRFSYNLMLRQNKCNICMPSPQNGHMVISLIAIPSPSYYGHQPCCLARINSTPSSGSLHRQMGPVERDVDGNPRDLQEPNSIWAKLA